MTSISSAQILNPLKTSIVALFLVLLVACNPATTGSGSNQASSASGSTADLQMAAPEEAGMDSARLDRVTQTMQSYVDDGLLAGVVTMAARGSKIVHFESVGFRDVEANAPMMQSSESIP